MISFKYYDIDEMHNIEIPLKNKSLSICHMGACSLNKYLSNNLNRNYYSFEFTPIETSAGGSLLYIANYLSYICCNDLNVCNKNELKFTFIGIFSLQKLNIIVGVIYRYPSMDLTNFNCNYLNQLLENISKEQKPIFLLGDFNVNLLNYNEHNQTNRFLDSLASNFTTNQNNCPLLYSYR